MNTIQTNYQALVTEENEVPHESVIFHAASEGGKPHWNHIGDLDTFFKNVYKYHQDHGFTCIFFQECKNALFSILIIFGLVYLMNGVNYKFDQPPSPAANKTDVEWSDLFLSPSECTKYFGLVSWILVIIGIFVALYKSYKLWETYVTFDDIKRFYTSAMKIEESKINHITWHDVQCRLREVQHEQQMCVHKSDLTELDISHRILRRTNYLVAMLNKNVLPVKFSLKILGEWVYVTAGMEWVLHILFFSRFSPVFKETGKLHEDLKKNAKRKEVAAKLDRTIKIFTVISIFVAPYLLVCGVATAFIEYAGYLRFSPQTLTNRQWSRYSKYYFRHFNELDHELIARLNRAYKPSIEYMKSFPSFLTVLVSRSFGQVLGAIAVFLCIWGLFNEKLFVIPGVLLVITICTFLFFAFQAMIPDENAVYFPKILMKKIIGEIHYVPDHFRGNEELPSVRDEFSQLFQYKFVSLFEELVGAFMVPYILYVYIRPRALDIVDFFRNFTVEVSGVGDVCSFALMDVSRHGNNQWLGGVQTSADQRDQAEGGKTELSLIHFSLMNPHWKPPPASDVFINDLKQRVNIAREGQNLGDPFYVSLNSLSTMDSKYASLVNSIHHSLHHPAHEYRYPSVPDQTAEMSAVSGGVSGAEGPLYPTQGGFLSSLQSDVHESLQADAAELNPFEARAADMSFSALYLHDCRRRQNVPSTSQMTHTQQPSQESDETEASPLLEIKPVH